MCIVSFWIESLLTKQHAMINIGIVGLGNIFDYQYKAISSLGHSVSVSAVYDVDSAKARSKVRDMTINTVICEQYSELLCNPNIDVVLISTPPHTHRELAESALIAKKNVIIEKPLCDNYDHILSLFSLKNESDSLLYSAFHAAFAEDLIWFINNAENLKNKYSLSQLNRIVCFFSDPYTGNNNIISGKSLLGGSYLDSGVNALSVCGKIVDLHSYSLETMSADKNDYGTVISSNTLFRSNVQGMPIIEINTNWNLGINKKQTLLQYENACILLDHSNQSVLVSQSASNYSSLSNNTDENWELLYSFTSLERLHAQYCRVFEDYINCYHLHCDNEAFSKEVHRLLFCK